MNLGSLFFSLGIKGAEKAKEGVGAVTEGLKKTASTSWEVKAGLLGAMYALERFTAAGNARGTGLVNLSTVLGIASQDIERYTWAAQQAGVQNAAVGASFEALQRSMTQMKFEGNANKWFALFSQFTGITTGELDRLREHPEQMVQKLQDFYNKAPIDKSLKNEIIDQFGVGALLPAFARNEFRPDVLNRAPTHSSGQIAALDSNRAQWANLGTTFDMAVDKLNAKFGGKLVTDISKLVPEVLKLVDSFAALADKTKALEKVGMVFEGWTEIFQGLSAVVDAFSDEKKMKALKANIDEFLGGAGVPMPTGNVKFKDSGVDTTKPIGERLEAAMLTGSMGGDSLIGILWDALQQKAFDVKPRSGGEKSEFGHFEQDKKSGTWHFVRPGPAAPDHAAPRLPSPAAAAAPSLPGHVVNQGGSSQVEFNQTLNFNDQGRDALKIGEQAARQVKTAYRQNPALSRVT